MAGPINLNSDRALSPKNRPPKKDIGNVLRTLLTDPRGQGCYTVQTRQALTVNHVGPKSNPPPIDFHLSRWRQAHRQAPFQFTRGRVLGSFEFRTKRGMQLI